MFSSVFFVTFQLVVSIFEKDQNLTFIFENKKLIVLFLKFGLILFFFKSSS